MLISFNLTFFPMHLSGNAGMPRRIYTYEADMGWNLWNLISTTGSLLLAVAFLLFLWNVVTSIRRGPIAPADPWDGATLEWAVSSPPPVYNFAVTPRVRSRRPLWDQKYPHLHEINGGHGTSGAHGESERRDGFEHDTPPAIEPIHLPSPTYAPLIVSVGIMILGFGIIYLGDFGLIAASAMIVGLLIMAFGILSWVRISRVDSPHHAH